MLSRLQNPPREANFQFTPPAASIPFPRRVSPPLSPSLSGSPPPPPFSSARLPAPHASARHGPAWIRRVAAYLPRLLVGERVLEGLFLLLLLRPLRLRADRVPHLLLGRRRRRGVHRLLAGLGGHQLLRNRRREASPSRAPAPTPVLSAQGGARRHGGGRGGGHAVGRDAGGQASPAPTPSRSPNLMTTSASDRFPIPGLLLCFLRPPYQQSSDCLLNCCLVLGKIATAQLTIFSPQSHTTQGRQVYQERAENHRCFGFSALIIFFLYLLRVCIALLALHVQNSLPSE